MYVLKKQNGNIRVTDVANKMECTKPSVNKALNNLKEEKLVNYETYGTIELTSEGENLAKKILEAYDIVYLFLKDVLNLEEKEAEKEEAPPQGRLSPLSCYARAARGSCGGACRQGAGAKPG